jgi:hypothetical protein
MRTVHVFVANVTRLLRVDGLVVSLGREAGIPTPGNSAVCDIVHRIERGELGPSVENMGLVDFDGQG